MQGSSHIRFLHCSFPLAVTDEIRPKVLERGSATCVLVRTLEITERFLLAGLAVIEATFTEAFVQKWEKGDCVTRKHSYRELTSLAQAVSLANASSSSSSS